MGKKKNKQAIVSAAGTDAVSLTDSTNAAIVLNDGSLTNTFKRIKGGTGRGSFFNSVTGQGTTGDSLSYTQINPAGTDAVSLTDSTNAAIVLNDGCLTNTFKRIKGSTGRGSFFNSVTGQGTTGDSLSYTQINPAKTLTEYQLDALCRNSRICQRLVKSLPVDSIKHFDGFTQIEKSQIDLGELWQICNNVLGLPRILSRACQKARKYGDGFIVLDVGDRLDPMEPLILGKSGRGRPKTGGGYLNRIDVLSRRYISPLPGTNLEDPEYYRIYYHASPTDTKNVVIHKSRVIRICGEELFENDLRENQGFNDSTLQACILELGYFCMTQNAVTAVLNRHSIPKLQIKDLSKLVLQNGADALMERFEAIQLGLSAIGALVMDADGENSEFMSQSYSGAEPFLDFVKESLVVASGYPLSHLLGASRTGAFSESGQSDRYAWAQLGREYQQEHLTPAIERLLPLALLVMGVDLSYAQELTPHYRSMMVLTREELANLKKLYSEADANYAAIEDSSGKVLYAQEIRNSRFSSNEFVDEITLEDLGKMIAGFKQQKGLMGFIKQTEYTNGTKQKALA
jgi:phage-related protein (TIGR01555 family)